MDKQEAIRLVTSAYPNRIVDKVSENDKYFLVNLLPKRKNKNGIIRPVLYNDGLKAVDKKTKQVFTYNPIRH